MTNFAAKLELLDFLLGLKGNQNEVQKKYDIAGKIQRRELNLAKPIYTRLRELTQAQNEDKLTPEQAALLDKLTQEYEQKYF